MISTPGEGILGKAYACLIGKARQRGDTGKSQYCCFESARGVIMVTARPMFCQGQQWPPLRFRSHMTLVDGSTGGKSEARNCLTGTLLPVLALVQTWYFRR